MGRRRVVVIGGGISGLAAAHRLLGDADIDVTVLEASPTVGGKLLTHDVGGVEVDAGAESVLARRREFRELAIDVGLGDRLVTPAATGVDIVIEGERKRLPQRQLLGIPFDFEQLAACGVLDRDALARAVDDSHKGPSSFVGDVSVGELVRTRMGDQVVERLIEPLLAGVYASSADEVSAQTAIPGLLDALGEHGSLAAAARSLVAGRNSDAKGFVGLTGGLGTLTSELGRRVAAAPNGDVQTSASAFALSRAQGGWTVARESETGLRTIEADGVVVAVPPRVSAALLAHVSQEASEHLGRIGDASVVLTTLVFAEPSIPALPPGSGMLLPPSEGKLTKAVTYTSQKWGWVADAHPGRVVIRLSMGRADDERALGLSDDEIVRTACRELSAILGQRIAPTDTQVTRWLHSIPQYPVGHGERLADINQAVLNLPGVELCGAWMDGVGIPTCIGTAQAAATRLAGQLA